MLQKKEDNVQLVVAGLLPPELLFFVFWGGFCAKLQCSQLSKINVAQPVWTMKPENMFSSTKFMRPDFKLQFPCFTQVYKKKKMTIILHPVCCSVIILNNVIWSIANSDTHTCSGSKFLDSVNTHANFHATGHLPWPYHMPIPHIHSNNL